MNMAELQEILDESEKHFHFYDSVFFMLGEDPAQIEFEEDPQVEEHGYYSIVVSNPTGNPELYRSDDFLDILNWIRDHGGWGGFQKEEDD